MTDPNWELLYCAQVGQNEDLMALIDFCNEAAGSNAGEVIKDAHDIAHVLLGGDKTRSWDWVADWLNLPTKPRFTTDAWPDVKERMLDVFERAGDKT